MDRSQDVYARPHQLHSEVWNALDLIAEDTALGDEILPVDPSKFPHPVVERPLARWVRLDSFIDHTDPVYLPRLLGVGGERRGEETLSA
jgi:hypothetical protein